MTALWRAARSGERLAMSSGRQLLDLVYVDDVVDAYIAAADALRTAGRDSCTTGYRPARRCA
ncbi:hypothetical protein LPB04_23305 [Massilia litorea]|uniref:NAD-dependent epimerase/dehydratase domain-containing protein n=1 Tax=Massilia litorea TaxID=2769491 RepID=A0A7L9U4F7_9BURK|nr:hypothetical protein LPB04_23305 [Massilia litorea]